MSNGIAGRKTAENASSAHSEPLDVVLTAMSEREFQQHVVAGLKARGWLCFVIPDMRKTRAGWPDVIAVHSTLDLGILALELKTSTGRVKPEQQTVLRALSRVEGVDARVLRPGAWARLRDALDIEQAFTMAKYGRDER